MMVLLLLPLLPIPFAFDHLEKLTFWTLNDDWHSFRCLFLFKKLKYEERNTRWRINECAVWFCFGFHFNWLLSLDGGQPNGIDSLNSHRNESRYAQEMAKRAQNEIYSNKWLVINSSTISNHRWFGDVCSIVRVGFLCVCCLVQLAIIDITRKIHTIKKWYK